MGNSTMYGPDLASNIGDYFSAQAANIKTDERIKQQNEFSRQMSSSAHQREISDLKLAGLNPILSGTGGAGASSSSGGFASAEQASLAASVPIASFSSPVEGAIAGSTAKSAAAAADVAQSQVPKARAAADFYKSQPEIGGFLEATRGSDNVSSAAAAAAYFGKKLFESSPDQKGSKVPFEFR